MEIIFVFAMTMIIGQSCSQMLSTLPECFSTGDQLTVNCQTNDFLQTIIFQLDGSSKGGCVPSVSCATDITQSGTTTSLTISSFNDSEHSGSWTCKYGSSTSTAVIIAENPCTTTPPTPPTTPPTTATTPSTSLKTCIFFKAESCFWNYFILALLIALFFIASLFAIGCFIKRKRNRRLQENSSASGKENKGNKTEAQELHKK